MKLLKMLLPNYLKAEVISTDQVEEALAGDMPAHMEETSSGVETLAKNVIKEETETFGVEGEELIDKESFMNFMAELREERRLDRIEFMDELFGRKTDR